jgi:multidrug efflux pump
LPTDKVNEIKAWIDKEGLPKDVIVRYRGADEQQDESAAFLILFALPAAFFMIFAVLLAMFNSFWHATVILIAAAMAVFGALLGSLILQQPFSVIMSGTGILALIGIVVNHNIVLIDTYHKLKDSGMERMEAVIRSSAQRLRPVFLTTLTAVLGLLPMMLAIEINFVTREISLGAPAALWWVSLSTAIVFGLVFSKLITLGLTPALLAMPGARLPRVARASRWVVNKLRGPGTSVEPRPAARAPSAHAIKEPHREAAE